MLSKHVVLRENKNQSNSTFRDRFVPHPEAKIRLISHLGLTGKVAQELRDLHLRPESVGLNLIF
jgi:hypothetical protein